MKDQSAAKPGTCTPGVPPEPGPRTPGVTVLIVLFALLPAGVVALQEWFYKSRLPSSWRAAFVVLVLLVVLVIALVVLARRPPAPTGNPTRFPGLEAWLPRIVGGLVPYFAGLGFARDAVYIASEHQWLWSLSLAACCFAIAGLVPWLTWWRRSRLNAQNPDLSGWERMRWLWLVCALLLLISCISNTAVQTLGTIPVALIALAGWTAFVVNFLVVPTWRYRWFSLFTLVVLAWPALLGLLWSLFRIPDNHVVREALKPSSVPQVRLDLDHAFQGWLEKREAIRASQRPYPIVIVAAEGGGIRAGYWTAAILGGLQDKDPFFRCHVFAISGVSGGSVGAVVWLGLLREYPGKLPDCNSEPTAQPEERTKVRDGRAAGAWSRFSRTNRGGYALS